MAAPRGFVPGLDLSRALYRDAVQPILAQHLPRLPYAAGLLGSGSDVLGFDTARSTDHDWGPRLVIVIDSGQPSRTAELIVSLMDRHLPLELAGHATRFVESPLEAGTPVLTAPGTHDGSHQVTVHTLPQLLEEKLGITDVSQLDAATWLTVSEQHLLELTAGAVWRDDLGALTDARQALTWYPEDVWRYRLAAGWMRISQHEAFVGRTGEVGDDLGSQLVALSIVRDIMQLSFLIERRYAPYEKWFGTAFARLALADALREPLDRARFARDWRSRESAVVSAGQILADAQNELGLCPVIDATPRPYFSRPFTVVGADRFAEALTAAITDPAVRRLPRHLGGLDQYVDTTDGRESRELHAALRDWLRRRDLA